MAKLRPGHCYSKVATHAYTRTARRVVKKGYVRGVPATKIVHFDMGDASKKYEYHVKLKAKNNVQIRSNALEACRIIIVRTIEAGLAPGSFHFQVRVVPHHVIRENAMISGAGADRLQTGMKESFGRPAGRSARVRRDQVIFLIKVHTEADALKARVALKKIIAKLAPSRIEIEKTADATK